MIIAAPSHTTSGPPSMLECVGDLGAAGQVLGQVAVVGDEPAEVDDATDPAPGGRTLAAARLSASRKSGWPMPCTR